MTVKELSEKLGLKTVCMPDPDREVLGGYAGDLLSWVMGRAPSDAAWMTIMSNVRCESAPALTIGAEIGEDVAARAEQQGINLLVAEKGIYEICVEVAKVI